MTDLSALCTQLEAQIHISANYSLMRYLGLYYVMTLNINKLNIFYKGLEYLTAYEKKFPEDQHVRLWHRLGTVFSRYLSYYPQLAIIDNRISLLKRLPVHSVGGELGVLIGDYSQKILDIVQPSTLVLIDLWDEQDHEVYDDTANTFSAIQYARYQTVLARFQSYPHVVIKQGLTIEKLSQYADNYFDWLYIDANHSYEAIKMDLQLAYNKVRSGGFICGHDYIDIPHYGVIRAVDEFICEYDISFDYLTYEFYPSFLLTKHS